MRVQRIERLVSARRSIVNDDMPMFVVTCKSLARHGCANAIIYSNYSTNRFDLLLDAGVTFRAVLGDSMNR